MNACFVYMFVCLSLFQEEERKSCEMYGESDDAGTASAGVSADGKPIAVPVNAFREYEKKVRVMPQTARRSNSLI